MQSSGAFRRVPRGHASSHARRFTSSATKVQLDGLLPGDDLGRDLPELASFDSELGSTAQDPLTAAEISLSGVSIVRLTDTDLVIADPGENVITKRLVTQSGESCGTVDDLLIALEARKALFLSVRLDDQVTPGSTTVLTPVEAIRRICPENVYVEHSLERLCRAPQCDFRATATGWTDRVYEHFGYPPFRLARAGRENRGYGVEHPYWSVGARYSPHLCLPDSENF